MPFTWSVVVRLFGRTAKFSKTTLEAAYVREMNITFSGTRSGGHSCSQQANWTLPQHETSVAVCCVTKLTHFRVAFVKVHLCNDLAVYQLLDMPHLSGEWIILAKEKCSLPGMKTDLCTIWKKSAFCAYGTFLVSFVSAHDTWDQHFTCCVYIFVQCISWMV